MTDALLTVSLALAWQDRADEQYLLYKSLVESPGFFKSIVMDEARIEFNYARAWFEFWRNQIEPSTGTS